MNVGQDPVVTLRVTNSDWVDLGILPRTLSVTTSCHSGISVRSLLNTSTDRKQVPPGLLFFPLSLAFVVDGLASSAGFRTIGA